MTAEIAILNRTAIALAADSAVTITVEDKRKTYDTAEKLFEFSRKQPIALMIYNNVEFVGVPLDVLVRKFRAAHDEPKKPRKYKPFGTLREAADRFVAYLRDFDHDIDEEERYLYFVLRERFSSIFASVSREVRDLLFDLLNKFGKPSPPTSAPSPSEILLEHLKKAVDVEKARPLKGYLTNVTLAAFRSRYEKFVVRAANDVFKSVKIDAALIPTINRLAFYIMKSGRPSNLLTGLVFGGFAEKDMFPTLHYLEIDGIYFGQVKITSRNEVDIDRKDKRAEVVPFAQKEMVERFMYGLDSELENEIKRFVGQAIDETLAGSKTKSPTAKSAAKSKVLKTFNDMMTGLKGDSRKELLDIVYFMSKKELGDIAYALVELTSQKRRFSTDEQSVGGPIDVAILTKSEGLVWIKRKHYFGPETNQGYYSRVFGGIIGGNNESKAAV